MCRTMSAGSTLHRAWSADQRMTRKKEKLMVSNTRDLVTSKLSRRAFLRGAAVSTIGLAAGCGGGGQPPLASRYDVVVVGAGIAGLGAAQALRAATLSVLVVEGRDR